MLDILYGRELALPSSLVPKVNDAADLLGISVDLPFKTIVSSSSSSSTSSRPDTAPPPLCCWHCNVAFRDLGELKVHIQSHQGEQFKKKLHKCQQCKKVKQ